MWIFRKTKMDKLKTWITIITTVSAFLFSLSAAVFSFGTLSNRVDENTRHRLEMRDKYVTSKEYKAFKEDVIEDLKKKIDNIDKYIRENK